MSECGGELLKNIQPLNFIINPFFFITISLKKSGFYDSRFRKIVVFLFLFIAIFYKVFFAFNNKGKKFEDYVENYGSIAAPILCLFSYIGYFSNSTSIVKTLNQIISKTNFIAEKSFLSRVFYSAVFQVGAFHVFTIASVIWTGCYFEESSDNIWTYVVNTFLDYFFWIHFSATSLLYSYILYFCRRIIKKINHQLEHIDEKETEKPFTPVDKLFVKKEKVNHIRLVESNEYLTMTFLNYDRICEWCLDFTELFGSPLAACCISNLVDMILYSYYLTKYGVFRLWMYVIMFFYSFFLSWSILSASENFRKEVQNTGIIVNRLVMESKSLTRKELLQQFSMLLLHRKIKFTAMGLFYLDYKLIYSALATVATYLAIAFQFEYASKSQQRNAAKNLTTTRVVT